MKSEDSQKKDQSNSFINDDDRKISLDLKFKKPRTYFGYSINFLRRPIFFEFKHPLTMKTCKFGYLLNEIHDDDILDLDNLMTVIPVPISFDPDSFFIKKINKWNIFNAQGKRIQTVHHSEIRANINIKILGYKQNNKGVSSPMMEVDKINILALDFDESN